MTNNNELITTAPKAPTLLEMRADRVRFPRLASYSYDRAVEALQTCIYEAFLYRGQQSDGQTANFIACALLEEILRDNTYGLRYLSIAEIKYVFKRAVLTDDKLIGITVASLYKVLLSYAKGEGRQLEDQVRKLAQQRKVEAFKASAPGAMIAVKAAEFTKTNTL